MDAKTDKSPNPICVCALQMNRGAFKAINRCHYFLQTWYEQQELAQQGKEQKECNETQHSSLHSFGEQNVEPFKPPGSKTFVHWKLSPFLVEVISVFALRCPGETRFMLACNS
jgi:hypothetical protein